MENLKSEEMFINEILEFCRADDVFYSEIENLYHASCYYLFSLTNKVLNGSTLEGDLFVDSKEYEIFDYSEEALAKLYIKTMCCDMFNNKNLTQEKASKKNYIYDSILNQLRY